jgi:ADP-dependent NAD(P)H-hydrate dehydratase
MTSSETTNTPQDIAVDLLRTMPLPTYSDDADKSSRGKLLIVAGSRRLPGAALLTAKAALRAGCGTVRLAAPESIALAIGIAVPELMVLPLTEKNGHIAPDALGELEAQFEACSAAVIGPGLDENDASDAFARDFIAACPLPLLVDAQGLCVEIKPSSAPRLFTPHDGEAASLGLKNIGEDRAAAARSLAQSHGAVVALKGRETFIATPEGKLFRNTAGSRALGTAGSGDVLAGVGGSLLAQGMDATAAAVWSVHLHALCGEAMEKDGGEDGILARDFIERLPFVLKYLRKQTAPALGARRVGLRPAG